MSFSLIHLSLLGQRESSRGLVDQTGIVSVNAVVNSVRSPTVVTLCCKYVLELRDKLLQLLDFSAVQVWPGATLNTLKLLTEP
jgi:hypothetical protein